MVEMYKCKYCGKKGTKEQLRNHFCPSVGHRYMDDDDDFLKTLILLDLVSESFYESPTPSEPEHSIEPGGGEFSGGGASGDYSEPAAESEPDSDSGGGDCGGGD
jgi:hypothetical protein